VPACAELAALAGGTGSRDPTGWPSRPRIGRRIAPGASLLNSPLISPPRSHESDHCSRTWMDLHSVSPATSRQPCGLPESGRSGRPAFGHEQPLANGCSGHVQRWSRAGPAHARVLGKNRQRSLNNALEGKVVNSARQSGRSQPKLRAMVLGFVATFVTAGVVLWATPDGNLVVTLAPALAVGIRSE